MQPINSIADEVETETIINKSRFITRLIPVGTEDEAKAKLSLVKEQYQAANHNVYAYRIGTVERFSDDGEPSGTAGKPVLEVLRRENLDNILGVVTRYFGGILLGAGGLIRAYTQSVKVGIDQATRVCLMPYQEVIIGMDYPWVNQVDYQAGLRGYLKSSIEYTAVVRAVYLVPELETGSFLELINELSAGQLKVKLGTTLLRKDTI